MRLGIICNPRMLVQYGGSTWVLLSANNHNMKSPLSIFFLSTEFHFSLVYGLQVKLVSGMNYKCVYECVCHVMWEIPVQRL